MTETHIERFDGLNGFDEAVMLSVGILGKKAYGLRITELLEAEAREPVSIAKVHVTLFKLERKGILSSELGAPTLELGGNSKRIYSICYSGLNCKALDGRRSVYWN
jgi:PadR family transcriptional regulator, regulatory protein PadR